MAHQTNVETLDRGVLSVEEAQPQARDRVVLREQTDGDLVVEFLDTDVIATGDVYVPLLAPCDLANGGRWDGYLDAVDWLAGRTGTNTLIVPGHAHLSDASGLTSFRRMLQGVTRLVSERISERMDRQQVVDAGLPERWAEWTRGGIGADFFLGNVYDGVQQR